MNMDLEAMMAREGQVAALRDIAKAIRANTKATKRQTELLQRLVEDVEEIDKTLMSRLS